MIIMNVSVLKVHIGMETGAKKQVVLEGNNGMVKNAPVLPV